MVDVALAKTTNSLPLVVDLDGTFLSTDTLHEGFVAGLFARPIKTLVAVTNLIRGRAAVKSALEKVQSVDYAALPKNLSLLAYLEAQHALGREIYLVTAANQKIADEIAISYPFFRSAHGSTDVLNLKGRNKALFLKKKWPDGFVYAGDSHADLHVWSEASGAITVATSNAVDSELAKIGVPIETSFSKNYSVSGWKAWRKALRLHQWSKNILIFVPLFLAHVYAQPYMIATVALGFLLMGLVASGTYILNDLSDLVADRSHRTKKDRPFASGRLNVIHGLVVALLLIVIGVGLGFSLDTQFGMTLVLYLLLTLSYSWRLKRVALVDVFVLGLLYTIRLFLGISLIDVVTSPWLIAFAFLFFYSLSLAKRHVEIVRADTGNDGFLPGRGYKQTDWPVTLSLGIATGFGSLIVIVLYLTEEAFPSGAYSSPDYLWAAPMLMTLWVQRIWLLSARGELDDDPVSFAIKDKVSMVLGSVLAAFFAAAVML